MAEVSWYFYFILVFVGLIAGVINTLAGGGSNLTLPALMIMGLPADIANATNRVGVFLQCLVGVKGFDKHNKLERDDIRPILIPTLVGSGVGALFAAFLPTTYLKPILLGTMITMALVILIKPATLAPEPGEPHKKVTLFSMPWWTLLFSGLYGGFVQAGVGFILIAALAGGLRYDLVRANALKMLCTGVLTGLALLIFIWQGQVWWIPGLVLAVGTMAGAQLGVKVALNVQQNALKWFLFLMTIAASAAALLF